MHFLPVWLVITHTHTGTSHRLYMKWSCRLLHIRPSTSFVYTSASQKHRKMLRAQTACLSALHWAPSQPTTTRREGAQPRRTRRQPISGLVSLQHLGGTEPSSGTCAPAARRKKTSRVRDAQLWFCEFDKKVEDHDTRWQKLNLPLVYHRCSFWFMVDLHVFIV